MLKILLLLGVLALIVGAVWLPISLGKKRRTTNPKGWRIPAIILAAGLLFIIIPSVLLSKQEERIAQKQAVKEAERDSIFAMAISANPDTANIQDIRRAVEIFKDRNWKPPQKLLTQGINLHLIVADSMIKEVTTLAEIDVALVGLKEVYFYGELNSQQQNKLDRLEQQLNQKRKKALVQARKEFAKQYEYGLLEQGMNVTVTTHGDRATTLKVKWILVSRVTAHEMSKDAEFFQTLRDLGFKKFIITDGYDESWYWDL
jgi:hypothetical protein